VLKGLQ